MKAGFDMQCDFEDCRLWLNGECADEIKRAVCPLMEARLDLHAADRALQKLHADLANAYQLIGELTE